MLRARRALTVLAGLCALIGASVNCPPAVAEDVTVTVLAEHDGWRIEGVAVEGKYYKGRPGQWFTGGYSNAARFQLARGQTCVVEGMMGWKVHVAASPEGEVQVLKAEAGPHLARPPRVELVGSTYGIFMPPLHEVRFEVPSSYYAWRVEDTPEARRGYWRTGEWTMTLPEGRWTLTGRTGWKVGLEVTGRGVDVLECEGGRYGMQEGDIRPAGFGLRILPQEVFGVTFQVPRRLGKWQVADFVGKAGDGFARFPAGEYTLSGKLIGRVVFSVDERGVRLLKATKGRESVEISTSGHRLIVRAQSRPPAPSVPAHALATYTLTKDSRRCFREGETVEFSVVLKGAKALKGRVLEVDLVAGEARLPLVRKSLALLAAGSQTFNFRLRTRGLRPADYTLDASVSGEAHSSAPLTVLDPLPDTHFKIVVYGGYRDPEVLDRFGEGGINLLINNGLGPHVVRARLGRPEELEAYERAASDPFAPPVETVLSPPWFRAYLEGLLRRGIDLLAQYGAGHQFFHLSTCFMDPAVYQSVCRGTMAMAQTGREFPNLVAFNLGDEMGAHRGFEHPEGCAYCRKLFRERFGFPVPDNPRDGKKKWLKWMDFKQQMFPVLMRYVGERVKQVADVMMSSQHGGANYWPQDGGYPPKGMQGFDVSAGHHYYAWAYGTVQTLFPMLGDELVETIPRKIVYWPFMLAHTGLDGTRHQIYTCLLRECEGAGYFTDPETAFPGQWEGLVRGVHPRLHRFGDFFLALDRDRDKEVAIFYSYRQHALDCYVDPKGWVRPVRRYLDRVTMALYACLRGHIPASFIAEEAIRDGKLFKRKVLLLVALTEIEGDIRDAVAAFIERGGVVFADAETTVDIPGVRRLDIAFNEFYDRCYGIGKFAEAEPPPNDDVVTIPLAKRLRVVLRPFVPEAPSADSPHLIITEQRHGDGRYLFLLNDNFAGIRKEGEQELGVFEPLRATVTIPRFTGALYDVFEGKRLNPATREAGGPAVIGVDLPPGEMKVLGWLPSAVGELSVKARPVGGELEVKATLVGGAGGPMDAALPVEVMVKDASGRERAHLFRALENGKLLLTVPLGINEAAGRWQVSVKELASGLSKTVECQVPRVDARKEAPRLVEELPEVIVYDADAIGRFLRTRERVTVVIGEAKHEALAARLARALQSYRGIQAGVAFDTEIGQNRFPRFYGRGTARSDWGVRIASPNREIDRDLILLGNPLGNELLADLYLRTELPPRLVSGDFPGAGRGVLQYVWQAFSDADHDAVLVSSMDDAGLERAASELIGMARK